MLGGKVTRLLTSSQCSIRGLKNDSPSKVFKIFMKQNTFIKVLLPFVYQMSTLNLFTN